MNSEEAEKQINQMVEFIKAEANEKAEEIKVKAEQEFNISKLEFIEQAKKQIREEYHQKKLNEEIKKKIEKSSLVTHSRLSKIEKRNEIVEKFKDQALTKLSEVSSHPKYGDLLVALIVQGLIRLKEKDVTIRVRKDDEALVSELLENARELYRSTIKRDTSLDLDVKLKIDSSEYLSGVSGGVTLICNKGKIVLNNTLDQRLNLAFHELKPIIRKIAFD